MKWNETKIRELLDQRNITISNLAESISVTRQTVHNWLNGSLPKGQDLLKLCKYLGVGAEEFFIEEKSPVTLIAHRTQRKSTTTPQKIDTARQLAMEYVGFFKQVKPVGIVRSLPDINFDKEYIKKLAKQLRDISKIENGKPMSFTAVLNLLSSLGIFIVFREFPPELKSYAFFCMIENHRVVFINSSTHTIDLIFQLLHETIHAIRSEHIKENTSKDEEEFCDSVACIAQFPVSYVKHVGKNLHGSTTKAIITILYNYADRNKHSMHGLVEALKSYDIWKLPADLNIYPSENKLRQHTPTIEQILFESKSPQEFVRCLEHLSPLFTAELKELHSSLSDRKLASLLGLPTGMDASMVREILKENDQLV